MLMMSEHDPHAPHGRRTRETPRSGFADGAADTAASEVTNVPEELGAVGPLIREDLLDDELASSVVLPTRAEPGTLRDWLRTIPDEDDEDDEDELEAIEAIPVAPEPLPAPPKVVKLAPEPTPTEGDTPSATPDLPRRRILASRARFAGHTALSMVTNTSQEVDELNNALAAFADLRKGQRGFISVTFRRCEEFSAESDAYIALLHGDDTQITRSRGQRFRDTMRYAFSRLWFEANRGSASAGSMPIAPWHRGRHVERAAPKDDQGRQTVQDAVRKARAKAHFEVRLNVGVSGLEEDANQLDGILHDVQTGFERYSTPYQALDWVPADPWEVVTGYMPVDSDTSMILSNEELGEIARVPDGLTKPHGVKVTRARVRPLLPALIMECQDPLNPPKGMVPIGVLGEGTSQERIVGMGVEEINKHLFIAGATGTGKSVLMERVVFGCVKNGDAIVVLDPHGTFVDAVRDSIMMYAPERIGDIVLVDAADEQYPLAFNPIDAHDSPTLRHSISSVMEMMRQEMNMTGDTMPRAINYATHAVSALAEANIYLQHPDIKCTLLNVLDFFQDAEFRQQVLALCTNPTITDAYHPTRGKFETMGEAKQNDAVGPVLSRFFPLGNSPAFANVFSAPHNKLDFETMIKDKKIILMKLGRFDTEPVLSKFMGNITIPYMLRSMHKWGRQQDKVTRKVTDGGVRMFVDEAHAMIGSEGSSAVTVLAEARKYNFGLVAATQFPEQLHPSVMKAFYGNTKSKICLALSQAAVGALASEIDGGRGLMGKGDVINLPSYYGYCNLLIADGDHVEQSGPFSVKFLGPFKIDYADPVYQERLAQVERQSRMMVCNSLEFMQEWRKNGYDRLKASLILAGQDKNQQEAEGRFAAASSAAAPGMPLSPDFDGDDGELPWPEDDGQSAW